MFRFFSSGYNEIPQKIDRNSIEEQVANCRMHDVLSYYPNTILPSANNTRAMLRFISDALETPGVQNNKTHLETLHTRLIDIKNTIAHYDNQNTSGWYKWLFWSETSENLNELKSSLQHCIERIFELNRAISNNTTPYQQA